MEALNFCPVCNHNEFNQYLECKDYFLSREDFKLVECLNCGFVFVNPRPKEENLQAYYNTPEYISHSGTKKGLINFIYVKIRNITRKKKFTLVNKYAAGKSILDVGCASGELLNYFKIKGWKVLGIEPNENARDFARTNFNIQVEQENYLETLENNSFDIVSMWHVLEHVSELNKRVMQITRIVKNNGSIIIALPNRKSYDAQFYKSAWAAYDVPRHLYHFSPENVKLLFSNYGFNLVSMLPMKFDAYYVSMLSEKYKTGKNGFLKGLYRGFLSNHYARKNNDNYSSCIYVFEKQKT